MKKLTGWERTGVLALVLVAWALRWVLLMEVPGGWRDDDLIELYTFSARIVEEGPVLYFDGASGHEPLYHTLRAPLIATAGINQASARLLAAASGTLVALLTWALGRRLLGRAAGLAAGTLTALSFWSLMYSRVAIRHIGVLPWALVALYWAWRLLRTPVLSRKTTLSAITGIAAGTGGALLTYYAGRLVPVLLLAALPFLAPRRGRLRPYLVGIALGGALALPMFWTAARLPGADARVSELALPIHALRQGDPVPLLQTTWTTLGMAHARGDPEWLYNTSERPVFGIPGALLFYAALLITLARWRDPASRFLLLWLGAGVGPAFISLPPSSYGHTILALPATYLILASLVALADKDPEVFLPAVCLRIPRRAFATAIGLVLCAMVGVRDLPDYFINWPAEGMVGFLYRAEYRALARSLRDAGAPPRDAAVSSMLFGPWDRVALESDDGGAGAALRWFDPTRALIFALGEDTDIYLTSVLARDAGTPVGAVLTTEAPIPAPEGMRGVRVAAVAPSADAVLHTAAGAPLADAPFAGALALDAVEVWDAAGDADGLWIATWWTVTAPLPLPEEVLIPNPPPPGVYNGPRLKVFAHLGSSSDEQFLADDGLWVDPYTLSPGDSVLQFHHFPALAPDDALLRLGLYDPLTGARWTTETGVEFLEIILEE